MKIGGFVKQSLIDYPGKLAAVVFTQGCNFCCGYCHNPQLVLPELYLERPDLIPLNIISYLEKHKNWLDGVVVTGGEPTIHKDLPLFLKEIKGMGYSVKLDTNGTNPAMLDKLIRNKLVDYIAMDIKIVPEKDLYSKITGIQMSDDLIEKILTSIIVLRHTPIKVEFRTTVIPGIHNVAMQGLIQQLLGNESLYTANEYREGATIGAYLKSETTA